MLAVIDIGNTNITLGVFDEDKERFYYVSDYYDTNTKSFNDQYATLIYYSNVSEGNTVEGQKLTYPYDLSDENYHGPRDGYIQLPTTSKWNNIALLNNERQILNEKGEDKTIGGILPIFSYTDKVARFLTVQEINNACNIIISGTSGAVGHLDTCEYLMENTMFSNRTFSYGYWTETTFSRNISHVWRLRCDFRGVFSSNPGNDYQFGVRPAIDVPKSQISY